MVQRSLILCLLLAACIAVLVVPALAKKDKHHHKGHHEGAEDVDPHHYIRVDDDGDDDDTDGQKKAPKDAKECPFMKAKKDKESGKVQVDSEDEENAPEQKIEDCPVFKGGKCPFNKHEKVDASKWGFCPAFQEGCPYTKDPEYAEKIKGCPVFKDGCPYVEGKEGVVDVDFSQVKEKCPAFKKSGCPFDGHHGHSLHELGPKKAAARAVLLAFLTSANVENLPSLVSEDFSLVVKQPLGDIPKGTPQDLSAIGHRQSPFKFDSVVYQEEISQGHSVVLSAVVDGVYTKDQVDQQINGASVVGIFTFNEGGLIQSATVHHDLP